MPGIDRVLLATCITTDGVPVFRKGARKGALKPWVGHEETRYERYRAKDAINDQSRVPLGYPFFKSTKDQAGRVQN